MPVYSKPFYVYENSSGTTVFSSDPPPKGVIARRFVQENTYDVMPLVQKSNPYSNTAETIKMPIRKDVGIPVKQLKPRLTDNTIKQTKGMVILTDKARNLFVEHLKFLKKFYGMLQKGSTDISFQTLGIDVASMVFEKSFEGSDEDKRAVIVMHNLNVSLIKKAIEEYKSDPEKKAAVLEKIQQAIEIFESILKNGYMGPNPQR